MATATMMTTILSHKCRPDRSNTVFGKRTIIRTKKSISTSALSFLLLLLLLLLSLTTTLQVVHADVRLPEYNISFASLPSLFGGKLNKNDPPVLAHLTLIKNQPFMCPDELKYIQPESTLSFNNNNNNNNNNSNNNYQEGEEINSNNNNNNNSSTLSNNNTNTSNNITDNDFVFTYDDIEQIPQPEDGLPVALLVERGMCTFYDKAIMASKYGDAVKYVIVYDDQIGSPDLVPMSSEYTTNMTLLFVTSLSGQEMRDKIFTKNNMGGGGDINEETKSPGILVEMDGISPIVDSPYPALNMAAYFLVRAYYFITISLRVICCQIGALLYAFKYGVQEKER
jgi:hypothetical protein